MDNTYKKERSTIIIGKMYAAWTKSGGIEKWFLSHANYFDADNNPVAKESHIEAGHRYDWSGYLYVVAKKFTRINIEQGTRNIEQGTRNFEC